jgi:hypothetical protein
MSSVDTCAKCQKPYVEKRETHAKVGNMIVQRLPLLNSQAPYVCSSGRHAYRYSPVLEYTWPFGALDVIYEEVTGREACFGHACLHVVIT